MRRVARTLTVSPGSRVSISRLSAPCSLSNLPLAVAAMRPAQRRRASREAGVWRHTSRPLLKPSPFQSSQAPVVPVG